MIKQLALFEEEQAPTKEPLLTPHHCHARGCRALVPPEMLMCGRHWRRVPEKVQLAVWRSYRVGQCDDKRPSREWLDAATAAIGFVARKDGLDPTKGELEAMAAFPGA